MTPRNVPYLDLSRTFAAIRPQVEAALSRLLDSQRFILGPEGEALEGECARLMGVPETVGVASGTDALLLPLKAWELAPGDEVLTSPFSFFATAGAVTNAGGRPVFADIDPLTYNLDPAAAAAAAGPRTRVICPVHLFGQTADVDGLRAVADRHGAAILEDAAQAFGAGMGDRPAGSLGDAAAFSFFPTKNLGGLGDGGLVASRDLGLLQRVRRLRHHGQTGTYEHALVGTNSRLDEIQAAVLRIKLQQLPAWTEERRRLACLLSEALEATGLEVRRGGPLQGADLSLPVELPGRRHVYNVFTIRAHRRDALRAWLTERGIGCGVYYPLPLHLQPCFSGLGYRVGDFPESERASREVLALPCFPGLTENEVAAIAAAVAGFYRQEGAARR